MSRYDTVYDGIIQDILVNGVWDKDQEVRTKWADGTPAYTKSIISTQIRWDNKEVPIPTKKQTAWMLPIKEILAFWQQKQNRFDYFHEQKIRFWDEWEIKNGEWKGTIGPSYGYQLGKPVRKVYAEDYGINNHDPNKKANGSSLAGIYWLDQVDYLIWQLKTNPASRRHVTSLWNIEDLDEMALNPCVWNTQWLVKKNTLHLIVGVRSNDMPLGNPFNVFQYHVLQRMIAQVTGYELGTLTFNINDAHIYERHIEGITEQINREGHPAPTLWINPDVKDFYDFTIDDFKLIDYKHGDPIKFEVAI